MCMKSRLMVIFFAALLMNFQAQGQTPGKDNFPKIGYTSLELVIGRLPESKAMQNQLETMRTQLEKAIGESAKEFETKVEVYQKTASQMTDIVRADKEKELENLQERVQAMRNKAQESLLTKQKQLMDPILTKVNAAMQEVGKENAYAYIFNMDGGPGGVPFILFTATEENNVTSLVLKKLGINPETPETSTKTTASTESNPPKPIPVTGKKP
jgi:outer membrane protein